MRIKKYILPFLFGLIGIFAFSPFSIKVLIYVSYAYLIRLILYSKNSVISKVFVWGLGHWGFGMSWIIVSIYYYGETHIIMALIIFLLLVILLTTVFTCPLYLIIKLLKYTYFKNNIIKTLYISSFFLSIELTRYFFLNGVPWLIPGDIFLDTYTQNIYSIFGVSLTSLIIYMLSTLAVINKKNKYNLIIIGIIFITLIPEIKKADNVADYPISIIQPSSDPLLKYEKDYYKKIEKNLINLFDKLPEESLLVVLPEAELPYSIQDIRFQEFINKLPKSKNIVMGAWSYENSKLYNTVYSAKSGENYKKRHLVPFGEYIPFLGFLRGLIDFFDLPMSNVQKGPKNQENIDMVRDNDNLLFSKAEIASPICFEIAFQNTVRKMNKSSNFMINVSNDTWFGNSIGPYHHLNIARVRAIENNKWIIRATNDGFSAIISNNGTIVDILNKGKTGLINGKINLDNYHRTIFSKYGYVVSYLVVFLLIIFQIYQVYSFKKYEK